MIEIKDGGTYAVKERVNVEGAAPVASQNTAPPAPAKAATP